jgi:hypothetical protein
MPCQPDYVHVKFWEALTVDARNGRCRLNAARCARGLDTGKMCHYLQISKRQTAKYRGFGSIDGESGMLVIGHNREHFVQEH